MACQVREFTESAQDKQGASGRLNRCITSFHGGSRLSLKKQRASLGTLKDNIGVYPHDFSSPACPAIVSPLRNSAMAGGTQCGDDYGGIRR